MKKHYNFIIFNKFTTISDAAFIASDIFSRWDYNLETQSLKEIRNNNFVVIYIHNVVPTCFFFFK